MRAITAVAVAAAAALGLLSACGKAPEAPAGTTAGKADKPAYQGATDAYMAQGWKAGDKASWEQHMRDRMQGQNEYARAAVTQ
jgi:hypothetical protein